MISLFSQEEVIKGLIASERREAREEAREEVWEEAREETRKENAQEMYDNGISLEVISKCIKESAETVKGWLGLTPEA